MDKVNVLKQKFLKERYEKDEKYFKVYDSYRYNYKQNAITAKFYSKYDSEVLSHVDENLLEQIRYRTELGPKFKFDWPDTTNHEYGWFIDPLVEVDRNDTKYYHPHVTPDFIKHDQILKGDITMKTAKFSGIPFKLG